MMHNAKQQSFIVEGNIGAGKSTFLKLIHEYLNVQIIFEPVDKWQMIGGTENLLDCFYRNPSRWAYALQSYAFISRLHKQELCAQNNPYETQIIERSIFSDRYCFAKNCFELGYMNMLEWQIYQEWFCWLMNMYSNLPTGFIYLQTDPLVCYERLKKRSRSEEISISLEYIEQLHEKHESWLVRKEHVDQQIKHIPVLIVNANHEFELAKNRQEELIEHVINFMMHQTDPHKEVGHSYDR